MNLKEFAALKPGDRIVNPMSGGKGRVVEADAKGVAVCWSELSNASFHYTVMSRAWVHWELEGSKDEAAT